MSERTDQHLLQLWANRADEIAFRAFADRYSGFVFGTARRRISDSSLAEEITQDVFAAAARQAAKLSSHVSVTAWLHRTTMLTVLDRMRRHARQRRKIEDLKAMHPQNPERDPWTDVLPQLDEALDRLRSADREILLLHFAEKLPFPQVATRLGTTVDAARMRTNRALEHLSHLLRTAGVTVPVAALAASLSGTFAQAAPVSLVLSPAAMAGAGKVMVSTVVIHAFHGLKAVHGSAAALASLLLAGVIFFQQKEIHSTEDRISGLRASLPKDPTTSALDSNALALASPASTSAQALDLRQLSLDALLGSYAGKTRIGATLARLDNNNLAGLLQTTLQGSLLPEPRRSLIVEILGEMERRSPALHLQTCLELMKTASADFFRDLGHRAQNSMQTWITKEPEAALAWARAQDGAWRDAHQRYRTWDDPSLMNRITAGFLIRDPARGYAMLEEMEPLAIKATLEGAVKDFPPGRLREIAEWGTQRADVEKRRRIVRTSVRFLARDRDDKITAFSVAGPILQKLPLSDADRAWIASRVAVDTIFSIERNPDKPPQAEVAAWMDANLPAVFASRAKGAIAHMLHPPAALVYLNRQIDLAPNDDLIAGYVESADLKWHAEYTKSVEPKDGHHGETAFRLATRVQDPARRRELLSTAWEDLHKDAPADARDILQKVDLTAEDRTALEDQFAGQLQTAR